MLHIHSERGFDLEDAIRCDSIRPDVWVGDEMMAYGRYTKFACHIYVILSSLNCILYSCYIILFYNFCVVVFCLFRFSKSGWLTIYFFSVAPTLPNQIVYAYDLLVKFVTGLKFKNCARRIHFVFGSTS